MKKIIVLAGLSVSLGAAAQTAPVKVSLQKPAPVTETKTKLQPLSAVENKMMIVPGKAVQPVKRLQPVTRFAAQPVPVKQVKLMPAKAASE